MAIFEEKQPKTWMTILLIASAFLLAYPLWNLGGRELFWNEGEYAVAASEMWVFPPFVTLHGQGSAELQPLFPLFARLLHSTGLSMEFSLRFLSVFPLAALTFLTGLICWRASGRQAGAAAAVAMATSLLVAEKGVEGYPHLLGALVLYGGWILWLYVGMVWSTWNFAWVFVGLFSGLAFYVGGFKMLMYFLIPLALQRRPATIWSKMKQPDFYLAILILGGFILLWLAPQWMTYGERTMLEPEPFQFHAGKWLMHVVQFPFEFLVRFFPWSLMMWAPFCAALIPLEGNPILMKFHRTLFWGLAVLLWLDPATKARDMIYLAPVVAVLVGMSYWIVVRRYGGFFCRLFRWMSYLILASAIVSLAFFLAPPDVLKASLTALEPWIGKDVQSVPRDMVPFRCGELALSALLAILACIFSIRKRGAKVWLLYLGVFTAFMLQFWAVVNPTRIPKRAKETFGKTIRSVLETREGRLPERLYLDPQIVGLYSETYYMGLPVTSRSPERIAEDENPVYILSADVFPASMTRKWTPLHQSEYKGSTLYLYRGEMIRKEDFQDDEFE